MIINSARTQIQLRSGEKCGIWAMAVVLIALTVVGRLVLTVFVAPRHDDLGETSVFGIGLRLTAYLPGAHDS